MVLCLVGGGYAILCSSSGSRTVRVPWSLPSLAYFARPYKGYNKAKFFENVVKQQERPPLLGGDPAAALEKRRGAKGAGKQRGGRNGGDGNNDGDVAWPKAFRRLLQLSWHVDPARRPSSAALSSCLMQLVIEQRYKEATLGNDDEQFEIPEVGRRNAPHRNGASFQGMASGIVSRLSEMTIGSNASRRGSEVIS